VIAGNRIVLKSTTGLHLRAECEVYRVCDALIIQGERNICIYFELHTNSMNMKLFFGQDAEFTFNIITDFTCSYHCFKH
jgi:hypothetical protein